METQSLQSLDPVKKLISDSWKLYVKYAEVWVKIWVIPVALWLVSFILSQNNSSVASIVVAITWIIGSLLAIPAAAGTILVFNGAETDFRKAYSQGFHFFWPLFGTGILLAFVLVGGFTLLIIPGFLLMIWTVFYQFTVVLEGKNGFAALSQSREYARGYWGSLFGRYVLLILMYVVLLVVIMGPVSAVSVTAGSVVNLLVSFVVTPFFMAFMYVLYNNLRTIKPELITTPSRSGRKFFIIAFAIGVCAMIGFGVLIATNPPVNTGATPSFGTYPPGFNPGGPMLK